MNDTDRILAAIKTVDNKVDAVDSKVDSTREEAAKHTGRVEAKLEGVGLSLSRVDKRLDSADKTQREHGERIARVEAVQGSNPDTTAPRTALQSAHDLSQILAVAGPPITPSRAPTVLREKWKAITAIAVAVTAAIPLAWYLVSLLP